MAFEKGHPYARIGGMAKTPRKRETARINGRLGGRPKEGDPYMVTYFCGRRKKHIRVFFKNLAPAYKVGKEKDGSIFLKEKGLYVLIR